VCSELNQTNLVCTTTTTTATTTAFTCFSYFRFGLVANKQTFGFYSRFIFTRSMLASADISYRCVSVCPSVTSRYSTEMAKRRITQTMPHDSRGTLVFWCQRSPQISNGAKGFYVPMTKVRGIKGTLRRRLSHGYFSFIAKYTSN